MWQMGYIDGRSNRNVSLDTVSGVSKPDYDAYMAGYRHGVRDNKNPVDIQSDKTFND